ncbi:GAF domain-containing protein [Nocardioides sp. W7]|uniref:GAF domain-containing protein n=1 Tax=Nocardioides sp. W7 TaxID=2931390 RepID=UPI001FD04EE2|nr:GAF domain-containing protein [Nocardioides sp. W7]
MTLSAQQHQQHRQYVDELARATSVEALVAVVRTAARRRLDADGATFVLRDGDQCFYADEDAITPLWKGQRFSMDHCISGWAMRHGAQASVPDIRRDARIPLNAYLPTFVRSLAMTPVGVPPVGALGVYWAVNHQPTPAELDLLNTLVAGAWDAMQRLAPVDADWPRLVTAR